MAAGLGFIEFTTGDVLSAAAANGYLASQSVMVFATAAARTTAITSPQQGMISFLKDTNTTQFYTGAAWTNLDTAASPLTTKGDIYGFSTVNARLAVGANNTVLTADSAQATGLKWATPASTAGMTKIFQGAFTAVSSASRTADFTATYDCYRIIFNITSATNSASTWFRFSTGGTDNTASSYAIYGSPFNAGTAQSKWDFLRAEPNSTQVNYISMDVINPKLSGRTLASGTGVFDDSAAGGGAIYFGGYFDNSTTFDGFSFIVTAGTITGTMAVYGYSI